MVPLYVGDYNEQGKHFEPVGMNKPFKHTTTNTITAIRPPSVNQTTLASMYACPVLVSTDILI